MDIRDFHRHQHYSALNAGISVFPVTYIRTAAKVTTVFDTKQWVTSLSTSVLSRRTLHMVVSDPRSVRPRRVSEPALHTPLDSAKLSRESTGGIISPYTGREEKLNALPRPEEGNSAWELLLLPWGSARDGREPSPYPFCRIQSHLCYCIIGNTEFAVLSAEYCKSKIQSVFLITYNSKGGYCIRQS